MHQGSDTLVHFSDRKTSQCVRPQVHPKNVNCINRVESGRSGYERVDKGKCIGELLYLCIVKMRRPPNPPCLGGLTTKARRHSFVAGLFFIINDEIKPFNMPDFFLSGLYYSKSSASLSSGCLRSFSLVITSLASTGHSMASSGSFHLIPASCCGA